MEKSTKRLRLFSILILASAAYSVFTVALELFFGGGFDNVTIPDGSPENIVNIAKALLLVITIVMILPQIYVGIKGICVAKNPDSSRGHIFWAGVLFVFALIGAASAIIDMANGGSTDESVTSVVNIVFDAIFYFEFITYARKVRDEY